jgi:hypothetical protein
VDFVKGVSVLEMKSYPLLGFQEFPEDGGIYFVFDDKGVVWYVGQTQNLRRRFAFGHGRRRDFCRFVRYGKVTYIPEKDAALREEIELRYIQELAPDLNITDRPKDIPTWMAKKGRQYVEFAQSCGLPLAEGGIIPLDDYHHWVLGAEPFFAESFVKEQIEKSLKENYELFLRIGDRFRRLTPDHIDWVIHHHFWMAFRQPQYDVPCQDRRRKSSP